MGSEPPADPPPSPCTPDCPYFFAREDCPHHISSYSALFGNDNAPQSNIPRCPCPLCPTILPYPPPPPRLTKGECNLLAVQQAKEAVRAAVQPFLRNPRRNLDPMEPFKSQVNFPLEPGNPAQHCLASIEARSIVRQACRQFTPTEHYSSVHYDNVFSNESSKTKSKSRSVSRCKRKTRNSRGKPRKKRIKKRSKCREKKSVSKSKSRSKSSKTKPKSRPPSRCKQKARNFRSRPRKKRMEKWSKRRRAKKSKSKSKCRNRSKKRNGRRSRSRS